MREDWGGKRKRGEEERDAGKRKGNVRRKGRSRKEKDVEQYNENMVVQMQSAIKQQESESDREGKSSVFWGGIECEAQKQKNECGVATADIDHRRSSRRGA